MGLGWYSYNPKDTVMVYEDAFVTVDYNKAGKMYRVTIFEDGHFSDEFWFNEYKDKELREKDIPIPVKRFDSYNHEWWAGQCPRCNDIVRFYFGIDSNEGNRKCYCQKCGQLCDFEDC